MLTLLGGRTVADPPGLTTLPIGAEAPDFRLPGVDGKTYSLKDFADAKVLVVVFTCNHCPTAQAYESRIAALHADYKDKGVAVVAISPNDPAAVRLDELGYTDLGDSFEDMKIRARGSQVPLSLPLRRRDPGDGEGLRRPGHAPRLHLRRGAASCATSAGFDDAEVKDVKSHDATQRRRGPAGGQAGPGRDDPRLRLLDQVGRQAGRRPEVAASAGTPSR